MALMAYIWRVGDHRCPATVESRSAKAEHPRQHFPDLQTTPSPSWSYPVKMKVRCPAKLAMYVFDLTAGGVAGSTVNLAAALAARGHRVDLVLCRAAGPFLTQVQDAVNLVELRRSPMFAAYVLAAAPLAPLPLLRSYSCRRLPIFRSLFYLPALVRYLQQERPDALLSAKTVSNLVALWAARLAGVPMRVVISERTHLSTEVKQNGWCPLLPTIRRTYPRADVRVAVSNGVADDLSHLAHIPRHDVVTIYNPVVHAGLSELAKAHLDHAWFQRDAPPVILGAGRLTQQKDFATLLRAFARVRRRRLARLVILGEGGLRADLEALARTLGVAADLDMPGFVQNPHAYMARAAVFALSSAWEGLGRVVIESLAAGCPVVSTDCASGPAEVLDEGTYGRLVPVGDSRALAEALVAALEEPPPREQLQRRAQYFSVERAADRYLDVLLRDTS